MTIYPSGTSTTNLTLCSNQLPFYWNGLILNSDGVYSVVLPDANGCDSTALLNLNIILCGACPANITITTTPFISAISESQTWIVTMGTVVIPSNGYVKLDADSTSFVALNPGFKTETGAVFVAEAFNGCSAGFPQTPPMKKLSDSHNTTSGGLSIYPNPSSGIIFVSHHEALESLTVFDLPGRILIHKYCLGQSETAIDLSALPAGVYLVKPEGFNTVKVIKY